jgi:D-alanine-D-alanine ligase
MTNQEKRKNIAILFGGRSVEHEISIITGLQLIKAIDTEKYCPIPVYIAPNGKWYLGDKLLDRNFYKNMPKSLSSVHEVVLLPIPDIGGLAVLQANANALPNPESYKGKDIIAIDLYFPAFHGSYGEDGCIQGLFELANIPYVGSDVLSSSIGMSKYHCKKLVEAHGISVLPSILISKEEIQKNLGHNLANVRSKILKTKDFDKFPLFIKPATLGSSIGIAKAIDEPSLDAALVQAAKYDTAVIIEPCLDNKIEINVSVLDQGEITASVVEIPVAAAGGELTYEDKYMRGGSKKSGDLSQSGMANLARIIDPQDLDPSIKSLAQENAVKAYKAIGCSAAVVRIDFMLDLNSNTLYFNEINLLPGSLAFYLWVKSNPQMLYTDMITKLIEQAEARHILKLSTLREIGFKALFK